MLKSEIQQIFYCSVVCCSTPFIQLSSGWGYYVLMLIATCRYSHWLLKQLSTFDESLRRHTQAPVRSHVAKLIPWVNETTLTLSSRCTMQHFFKGTWVKKKDLFLQ